MLFAQPHKRIFRRLRRQKILKTIVGKIFFCHLGYQEALVYAVSLR